MNPFLGPTYPLASRPASVQRTINLMPIPNEPGNERAGWVFKDVPGLVLVSTSVVPPPIPPEPDDGDPFYESVLLLSNALTDTADDESIYDSPYTVYGQGTFASNTFSTGLMTAIDPAEVRWTGNQFWRTTASPITVEAFSSYQSLANTSHPIVTYDFPGVGYKIRIVWYGLSGDVDFQTTDTGAGNHVYALGSAANVDHHFAIVIPAGINPTARVYANGNLISLFSTALGLYPTTGEFSAGTDLGLNGAQYKVRNIRVTQTERYTGATYTVPTIPLPNSL